MGDEESLNESMDSQLSGDVALGLEDIEDIGGMAGAANTTEYTKQSIQRIKDKKKNKADNILNNNNDLENIHDTDIDNELDKDRKPKTKIATRLKTLKKMSNLIKRKRIYQLEKEVSSESNKIKI